MATFVNLKKIIFSFASKIWLIFQLYELRHQQLDTHNSTTSAGFAANLYKGKYELEHIRSYKYEWAYTFTFPCSLLIEGKRTYEQGMKAAMDNTNFENEKLQNWDKTISRQENKIGYF